MDPASFEQRWRVKMRHHGKRVDRCWGWMFMGLVVAILISQWIPSDSWRAADTLKTIAWLLPGLAVLEFVRQATLHYYARGIVSDLPEVEAFRKQEPQFPLDTVRWMVARKRLWKSLLRSGCWLAGTVAGALGFFALDQVMPGIEGGGALLLLFALFCAVVLLIRAACFVFASRLMGIGDREARSSR